jgi:hypothetical protein
MACRVHRARLRVTRALGSRLGCTLAGLLLGAAIAAPAAWAAMTVYDPTVNVSTLKVHAEAVKQLAELEKQLAELRRVYATLGRAGAIGQGFGSGVTAEARRLAGLAADVSRWELPRDFNAGSLNTLQSGVATLRRILTVVPDEKTGNRSANDADTVHARRAAVHEDAAYHALALALSEREATAQAIGRVSALASEAQATVDLHADLVAGNKLKVAEVEQLVAIRALLGALVEVAASGEMRQTSVVYSGRNRSTQSLRSVGVDGAEPFGK